MALVEIYHVVAAMHDVDSSSETIKEGMLVALTSGGVRRVETGDDSVVYGIAGDTNSTSASAMPGVASGWQNRVSDMFDETRASGKLTVYHSGGEFATDQYVATPAINASKIGRYLVADEATGKLKLPAANDDDAGALAGAGTPAIAQVTGAAGYYPSGVPGVDINGDLALGGENSNTYITFKLLV